MSKTVAPGFLVVDKPAGVTSHDVVAVVRALVGAKRVGHTGTLDPFATGVLPLALGPATRLISFLNESHKVYEATIALGVATCTGDPEGDVSETAPVPAVSEDRLRAVLAGFEGPRMQTPPPYSAVKVNGRPLYSYARAGETVSVEPRPIVIHRVELLGMDGAALRVRVECGRGTYIRVLGEEIARALGTVGHLTQLRRLKSGPFTLASAVSFPKLAAVAVGATLPREDWRPILRPGRGEPRVEWVDRRVCRRAIWSHVLSASVGFSSLIHLTSTDEDVARLLQSGVSPPPPPDTRDGDRFVVVDGQGMVALCERIGDHSRSIRVLARPPVSAV